MYPVKAMERVLDNPDTDAIEIFNIGTGKGLSTLEVVQGFEKATGVKVNWEFAPRREGDIEQVWGNVDKANKVLGWKAETPTEEERTDFVFVLRMDFDVNRGPFLYTHVRRTKIRGDYFKWYSKCW